MNAMLNYAYAVLESQVLIATVARGLDPTIGYLHACRPGRLAVDFQQMLVLQGYVLFTGPGPAVLRYDSEY